MRRIPPAIWTSWTRRLSVQLGKARKQLGKHRLGSHPTIETILELLDVALQILRRDAGMGALDGALEVPPEVLD